MQVATNLFPMLKRDAAKLLPVAQSDHRRPARFTSGLLIFLVLLMALTQVAQAATPGNPFTEPFSDTTLQDPLLTNVNWSTDEEALVLAWHEARYGTFGPSTTGSDISSDSQGTLAVALGDVDGDGDLSSVTYATASGKYQYSTTCTFDDEGTYMVKGKLRDVDGAVSDEYTADVIVNNVAPQATLSNDGPVIAGSAATMSFTAAIDPSSADIANGLRYAFACDNGDLSGITYATASSERSGISYCKKEKTTLCVTNSP